MGKSYPDPPDPRETAAASTGTNVGTAIANAYLGNVNQVTPDGSLKYEQTGTKSWYDPFTEKTYDVPTFTVTQELAPWAAATKAQTDVAQYRLANLAQEQAARVSDLLNKPVDFSNNEIEGRLFDLGRQRLDPMFSERRAGLEQQLANQGVGIGSKAYDTAMRGLGEQENDAYNNLLLSGRGQAVQEMLAARNQPINETTALLSGSQVSQPNFVNSNQPTIPTTDVAGLINENYNQRLGIAQQKNAATQGLLGGLFSLGSSFLYSDRRLKEGIARVGTARNGLPVYSFQYKGDGATHYGFMADEVMQVRPDAVQADANGFLMVDYSRAVL